MKKNTDSSAKSVELRRKAEERLWDRKTETDNSQAETNTQRLLHELQVHHIELEMQNEELRQAKDELEAMLIRASNLHDFAPVGYVTLDSKGVIRNANLTCSGLLGIERSRLVGESFLRFVTEDSFSGFHAFLAGVFGCQAGEPCEALLHTNERHPLYARIEGVLSGSGDECLVAIIDITRSKLAEKDLKDNRQLLQELNDSLEQRVDAGVEELRRKDNMLLVQNRQAAMGEMIGYIAHQWRQPLNSLGLKFQELQYVYRLGRLDNDFLETYVRDSMQVVQYMSQTIDDFRSFFVPDKETVIFEVNRQVDATIGLISDSLKFNRIKIDVTSLGGPSLNGCPSEFSQVLLNIIMNAQDALLENKVDQPCIRVSSFMENEKAVITIADNAGGVPVEILGRIFEPYFTTKSPHKGTGIGLFMAETIIKKNMGGRLTVRNINGGAEFRIEV